MSNPFAHLNPTSVALFLVRQGLDRDLRNYILPIVGTEFVLLEVNGFKDTIREAIHDQLFQLVSGPLPIESLGIDN